jgi:hypothetical protein
MVCHHVKDRKERLFQFLSKAFGKKKARQSYRRAFLGSFQGVENSGYGCVILQLGSWLSTFRWSILFPNSGSNAEDH